VSKPLELAVTVVAGAGLPISQLAIRRLGWPGAAVVTAVTAGILAADLEALARGRIGGSVRRVVRLEAAAASVATVAGALLLLDPGVEEARDEGWRVGRAELLRRVALGLVFGILSARLRAEPTAKGRAAVTPAGQGRAAVTPGG
jgi:hypothetical protein